MWDKMDGVERAACVARIAAENVLLRAELLAPAPWTPPPGHNMDWLDGGTMAMETEEGEENED